MEKETLEEAAERIYREYPNNPLNKPEWHYNRDINCFKKRKAFILGAKWQQERMYSEEDMEKAFTNGLNRSFDSDFDRWFEQFKKK